METPRLPQDPHPKICEVETPNQPMIGAYGRLIMVVVESSDLRHKTELLTLN